MDKAASKKVARISPADDYVEPDLRFHVNSFALGRLERLAMSNLEMSQLVDEDFSKWLSREVSIYSGIAQSVKSSSSIEGEDVIVAASFPVTESDIGLDLPQAELNRRAQAGADIYDTYIWALQNHRAEIISVEFILELHRKMFKRALGEEAGRFKKENVAIQGGQYSVETVSWRKAEGMLQYYCERFRERWSQAAEGRYNYFLLAGEFIIDFLAIHPFLDGNGRLARLISTYLLEQAGYHFPRFYSLEYVIHERRDDYYSALFLAQEHWMRKAEDLTPWINFYIDCVDIQCRRTIDLLKRKKWAES